MPAWFSLPKTLVEGTKARAADVQEDLDAIKNALLYLLSEEEHSIFPQLKEAAKRILTMSGDVTLDTGSSTRTITAREDTTLKGSGGTSDFLQLPSTAKRKVLWGRVNSFAGVNGGSGGFTVTKEATGVFVVNFETAFSTDVTPTVTDAGGSGQHFIRVTNISTSSFRVAIFNGSLSLEDSDFNFTAIG